MDFIRYFSRAVINEANVKLSKPDGISNQAFPHAIARIITDTRKTEDELRAAFRAAALRLKQG